MRTAILLLAVFLGTLLVVQAKPNQYDDDEEVDYGKPYPTVHNSRKYQAPSEEEEYPRYHHYSEEEEEDPRSHRRGFHYDDDEDSDEHPWYDVDEDEYFPSNWYRDEHNTTEYDDIPDIPNFDDYDADYFPDGWEDGFEFKGRSKYNDSPRPQQPSGPSCSKVVGHRPRRHHFPPYLMKK